CQPSLASRQRLGCGSKTNVATHNPDRFLKPAAKTNRQRVFLCCELEPFVMTEPLSKIPEGFRYFSAIDASVRRSIEATIMSVFDGWNYEEIITPTVDYYSLFECGMGNLEAHSSFRFTDRDSRLLALRPDVTSAIARAAASLCANRPRPLLFCYAASVFRQQPRSHANSRRESKQIGCELLGRNSTTADMEVLVIAAEILRRLDLGERFVIT